jgi:hypothetical protein
MSGLLHACWLPAGCLWPLLLLLSACRGRTEVRVAFRSCCWLLLFHCAWRVAAGCLCLSACLRKLFICNFMQSGHLNLLRLHASCLLPGRAILGPTKLERSVKGLETLPWPLDPYDRTIACARMFGHGPTTCRTWLVVRGGGGGPD